MTQKNSLFHFMPFSIKNCLVLLRNFIKKNMLNKIQFNTLYINIWMSSLNIFEENQFMR